MAIAVPPASADPLNLWVSTDSDCVDDFFGGSSVSTRMTTSLAPDMDALEAGEDPFDPGIIPTNGSHTTGDPATVTFTVPSEYFEGELASVDADEVVGFYMMGFEFLDDCSDQDPAFLVPCFDFGDLVVWPLSFSFEGGPHFLFFFFRDFEDPNPQTSFEDQDVSFTVSPADVNGACNGTEPNDRPEDLPAGLDSADVFDLIDDLDLEVELDLGRRSNRKIDLDHYLARDQPGETALPNTL